MTYLTLWLLSGVLALMWFFVLTFHHTYEKGWHEVADYTVTFALGPVSLLVFAGWEGWRRWQGWRAAQ